MSAIYLLDPTTLAVLFEFDADIKESRSGSVKWSAKPIESGSTISDYGYRPPMKYSIEGVITAWPWNLPRSTDRVINADKVLDALAAKRQPVALVTFWWAADVVITSERVSSGQGDGEMARVSIELQTYSLPQPAYTTIPASRLKASVRKRATPKPSKGGAAAGKGQKKPYQDAIYNLGLDKAAKGLGKAIGGIFGG